MKYIVDVQNKTLKINDENQEKIFDLYSIDTFDLISKLWLQLGWNLKYSYTFTWMGRPIIQIPEDMIRIQEVIFQIRPSLIIECGIAHGGSLIYYASLMKILGHGRVVGIDIEIRSHNRSAIESHFLYPFITLIEGDSTASSTLSEVKKLVEPTDRILIILDSNHTKDHVIKELEAYHQFVTKDSYIVVADGIMKDLGHLPRGSHHWERDNPMVAVQEFLQTHKEFDLEDPCFLFNESELQKKVTYWPHAWLKRVE